MILITIHAVNSIIVFTWVNFISFKLLQTIRNKRKIIKNRPINVEVFINIGNALRNAKRLVDRLKKVKINDIEIIIP